MGCLFEFFFELVFEIVVEAIASIYIKLMTLCVPYHKFDKKLHKKIKNGVATYAAVLLLSSIIGFLLFLHQNLIIKAIGKYMLFVPLIVMGIQIILGIIYRIIKALKNKQSTNR